MEDLGYEHRLISSYIASEISFCFRFKNKTAKDVLNGMDSLRKRNTNQESTKMESKFDF